MIRGWELPKKVALKSFELVIRISCSTISREMVEVNGIEPMTSCLQSRRSPN